MKSSTYTTTTAQIAFALEHSLKHYVPELCISPVPFDILTRNLVEVGFELDADGTDPQEPSFLQCYLEALGAFPSILDHGDFSAFEAKLKMVWQTDSGPCHFIRCLEDEDVSDVIFNLTMKAKDETQEQSFHSKRHIALQLVALTLGVAEPEVRQSLLREDCSDVLIAAEHHLDDEEIEELKELFLPKWI